MSSMIDLLLRAVSAKDALVALAVVAAPLLIALLLRRPVPRRYYALGAFLFVTLLFWMTAGNAAYEAAQRGEISAAECILLIGGLFAVLAASNVLLERWSRPRATGRLARFHLLAQLFQPQPFVFRRRQVRLRFCERGGRLVERRAVLGVERGVRQWSLRASRSRLRASRLCPAAFPARACP